MRYAITLSLVCLAIATITRGVLAQNAPAEPRRLTLADLPQVAMPIRKMPRPATPRRFDRQVAPVSFESSPPLSGQARAVMNYYGSHHAMQTLQSMPRRPSSFSRSAPQVSATAGQNKPFSAATQSGTISPYLNLYREESNETAPNYYTFVKPGLQQQETNHRQRAELQRLERQMQGNMHRPATSGGHTPRYLDTGSYYSGVGR